VGWISSKINVWDVWVEFRLKSVSGKCELNFLRKSVSGTFQSHLRRPKQSLNINYLFTTQKCIMHLQDAVCLSVWWYSHPSLTPNNNIRRQPPITTPPPPVMQLSPLFCSMWTAQYGFSCYRIQTFRATVSNIWCCHIAGKFNTAHRK